jgi:hypothetical protein
MYIELILFSIFIDDPVDEINELGLGVNIRDSKLSILLYADDIVLVALSEADMQNMLDKLPSISEYYTNDVLWKVTTQHLR